MFVKIFTMREGYFRTIAKASSNLEQDINAWLRANPGIQITNIKQTSCGGSLEPSKTIVSVWYEENVSEAPD